MPSNKDQTNPRSFSGIPLYVRRATCRDTQTILKMFFVTKNWNKNSHITNQRFKNKPNSRSNHIKQLKGSVKEPNMFHNYETEKITRKANDAAENLQLYWVVRFFCQRSSCTMHLMLFSERPPIYTSFMTISGGRTEQHIIIGFGELAAVD